MVLFDTSQNYLRLITGTSSYSCSFECQIHLHWIRLRSVIRLFHIWTFCKLFSSTRLHWIWTYVVKSVQVTCWCIAFCVCIKVFDLPFWGRKIYLYVLNTNISSLAVFQTDQLSSVSVHLQLNLVEHVVGEDVSSALPNTLSILFTCMRITTLAIHGLCLLVDSHTELQLCANDTFYHTKCTLHAGIYIWYHVVKPGEPQMNWNWTELSNLKHFYLFHFYIFHFHNFVFMPVSSSGGMNYENIYHVI